MSNIQTQGISLIPSTIYVSELLRTWETAVLLFLNDKTPILTLFISPFLREDGSFPSDKPGYLQEQLFEFMRFLVFLGQLKNFTSNQDDPLINKLFSRIPNEFKIIFKHYAGSFTEQFISGIKNNKSFKIKLTSDGSGIEITCNISDVELDGSVSKEINDALKNMMKEIIDINGFNDDVTTRGAVKYKKYNDNDVDNPKINFPKQYKIPEFDTTDLNKVSSPPSISTFAKWYTEKIKPTVDPVYFVSHSHIMQSFVKEFIKNNEPPTDSFMETYNLAKKTNSWSLGFYFDKVNFKGFRHAFSCDNRFDKKGLLKIVSRIQFGAYTNLALWGILSTLLFAQNKMPELIQDNKPARLKVYTGMIKETKQFVSEKYDKFNMLCGARSDRVKMGNFEVTLSNCGTSSKLTLTLDNDCIKIKCRQDDGTFNPQKVVLQLSKNDPRSIEVKFFKDDSNTYTSPPIEGETTSLLNIASFLSGINIPDQPTDNENTVPDELKGLTLEMTEAISNFINSDVFKKTKNNAMWGELFTPFSNEINQNVEQNDVDFSGGRGCGLVRRSTKKMRKYKKYTKKYYRCQSRRKSRRVRKHRRKSCK
jgi:hypothetical protein